jgi:hypothetical protein
MIINEQAWKEMNPLSELIYSVLVHNMCLTLLQAYCFYLANYITS